MADTLAAQIAETENELIAATVAQLPQFAPMLNLVTRVAIPKGSASVEIPRETGTFTVVQPAEGDELVTTSQYDLTSTTITPTLRVIRVRISERATYHSRDDVVARVSAKLARHHAQDMDTDLTAEFGNFHTDNDVGTSNTPLTLAVLRTARRLLDSVTMANGGPAPDPRFCVLHPIPVEDLLTNLGVQGVVASTSPWIPEGLSQQFIQKYLVQGIGLVGVPIFWDGYMTEDGSGDFICAMFSKQALHIAISKDWQIRTFESDNWLGPVLRSRADYESGVGAYTHWGAQITADGS